VNQNALFITLLYSLTPALAAGPVMKLNDDDDDDRINRCLFLLRDARSIVWSKDAYIAAIIIAVNVKSLPSHND